MQLTVVSKGSQEDRGNKKGSIRPGEDRVDVSIAVRSGPADRADSGPGTSGSGDASMSEADRSAACSSPTLHQLSVSPHEMHSMELWKLLIQSPQVPTASFPLIQLRPPNDISCLTEWTIVLFLNMAIVAKHMSQGGGGRRGDRGSHEAADASE